EYCGESCYLIPCFTPGCYCVSRQCVNKN
nr:RecName: Full=Chassatide C12; AltName: Full=Cyclotide chaC12 [Chassalia chartacea]